jgi:hypothetical protein
VLLLHITTKEEMAHIYEKETLIAEYRLRLVTACRGRRPLDLTSGTTSPRKRAKKPSFSQVAVEEAK